MMASTADAWQEPDSTTGCAPWMRGPGRQVALELGQGREDVERELAARGGGVDRLLEAPEPDAALSHAGDGVDQMPEGAAEAVQFPDDQSVARAELVQDLGRGWGGRSGRRWPSR
jgi:hypothetical protein